MRARIPLGLTDAPRYVAWNRRVRFHHNSLHQRALNMAMAADSELGLTAAELVEALTSGNNKYTRRYRGEVARQVVAELVDAGLLWQINTGEVERHDL